LGTGGRPPLSGGLRLSSAGWGANAPGVVDVAWRPKALQVPGSTRSGLKVVCRGRSCFSARRGLPVRKTLLGPIRRPKAPAKRSFGPRSRFRDAAIPLHREEIGPSQQTDFSGLVRKGPGEDVEEPLSLPIFPRAETTKRGPRPALLVGKKVGAVALVRPSRPASSQVDRSIDRPSRRRPSAGSKQPRRAIGCRAGWEADNRQAAREGGRGRARERADRRGSHGRRPCFLGP